MEQIVRDFKSIFDLLKKFNNEQVCIDHLEMLRWNGEVVSPFDPTSKVYKCPNNRYKCKNTNKYFNVRTGSIFEDTKLPLQKWFMALFIFSSHKKGISSHQLAKDISITQKSAWFVLHRLRYAFNHEEFKKVCTGITEIGETFIGGKESNKHRKKQSDKVKGKRIKTQTPVMAMLERGKKVIAKVVPDTKKSSLLPVIYENLLPESVIVTDELPSYLSLKSTYEHHSVRHSIKEYVRGNDHVNGMENFWSQLKRGLIGIYHQVSVKHLQSYVDEFALRYITRERETQNRFDLILSNVAGKRLTYNTLISK